MSTDKYTSPLSERYARVMCRCSISFHRIKSLKRGENSGSHLAETENELGLKYEQGGPAVTTEQIDELKAHAEDINYDVAKGREKAGSSRCYESCVCIWTAVSEGERNYSFGSNFMLCRR